MEVLQGKFVAGSHEPLDPNGLFNEDVIDEVTTEPLVRVVVPEPMDPYGFIDEYEQVVPCDFLRLFAGFFCPPS